MPVEVIRGVLTFRLSPEGDITPTVVIVYTVDGEGPFLLDGGPPPVRAGEVARAIREQAERIRVVRHEHGAA